jgi:DNA repair exonuclease SbcCD ATPase subunit
VIQFGEMRVENFGPFATARLRLGGRGLVLVVGENRDTTAASSNGTGKTSLLRALSWVLFGNTLEGDKTEEVVRHGQKNCRVEVDFSDGESQYLVSRARRGGKPTLELSKNGKPVTDAVVKDTQAEICRLLGLDFQTFRNTVLYGQGDIRHFADPRTSDADRKLVLKRVLRLEVLEGALRVAKDKASTLGKERELHRSTAERARAQAEASDPTALDGALAAQKARLAEVEKKLARRPKLEKLLADVEDELAEYGEKRAQLRAADDRRTAAQRELDALRARERETEREGQRLAAQVGQFKGGKCPVCGTPATGVHVRKHVAELKKESGENTTKMGAIAAGIADAQDAVDAARAAADALRTELADEQEWIQKRAELRAELKALDTAAAERARLEASAGDVEARRRQVEERRETALAALAASEARLAEIDDEVKHLDFWVRGFGDRGLLSFLLDQALPDLEERANHYLGVLSDGDIQVRFDTESSLKSGEVRDKFAIDLLIEGIPGVRPSAGQLKKLTLAVDLALMDLVGRRDRANVDLLLLDEVLDGLDATGRARVVDLLLELRKTKGSIFVISHDPGLAQAFEAVETVVKEGGVARLEGRSE